jgi:hypothetical protein
VNHTLMSLDMFVEAKSEREDEYHNEIQRTEERVDDGEEEVRHEGVQP